MESIFTQLFNEPNADVQFGLIAEIYGQMSKDIFGGVKYQKTAKLSKASFLKALDIPKLKINTFIGEPIKRGFQNLSYLFHSLYRYACSGLRKVAKGRKNALIFGFNTK